MTKLRPLRDKVLVTAFEKGMRKLSSGIVLPNDDGKDHGIRPRWAQVYAVGSDVVDIKPGQWVLVNHGRWSRGATVDLGGEQITVYQVDWMTGILGYQDAPPDIQYG